MQARKPVGKVVSVQRYPVKSMLADPLQQAELRWNGLPGDRQYAFLKTANHTRFPWFTGRDAARLLLYRARYEKPDDPKDSAVTVTSPTGNVFDLLDPRLTAELTETAGEPVQLLRVGRGLFDSAPVSVITTTTGARITETHGSPVDVRRFRANIVIEPFDAKDRERDWLGGVLSFGGSKESARLRLDCPIERCSMITRDPDSAEADLSLMRTVAQHFGNEVGVYGATETIGTIRPGDEVFFHIDQ